jgi:hypothetical protein
MKWKPDWPEAKQHLIQWWDRKGLVLCLFAPRSEPAEDISAPPSREGLSEEVRWTDPKLRCDWAIYDMSRTDFLADAFPLLSTQIGPGSLGTFLGSRPHFAPSTVWYEPCIIDPDSHGPIRFNPRGSRWFDVHMALVDEAVRCNQGRYLIGMPDLIENVDTLAALRDTQTLMLDFIERPAWVHKALGEINEAFFAAFDCIYPKVRSEGGNAFGAFHIWGPGKTAKVQCDASCMLSPAMFKEFVVPYLSAQCDWLDYSMYHLDGEDAMQHLDALLAIESLDAIEWTPVGTSGAKGRPPGGSPVWYDLYRRIKRAGKSVQAVGVRCEEVVPLLDAVGPEGMFIMVSAPDQLTARKLLQATRQYR